MRVKGTLALIGLAGTAFAADGRLYPSGPPNGVGYLRFANLAPAEVTIVSPAAKIAIPTDDAHRVGEFDPVTPGVALAGSAQFGEATKPINVTLQQNEFVTVAVTGSADTLAVTLFRETPSDFNALKSSIGLFNPDQTCVNAQLLAADQHTPIAPHAPPAPAPNPPVNPAASRLPH